jgi:peptidyl-prolyl cis-trans isomerase C
MVKYALILALCMMCAAGCSKEAGEEQEGESGVDQSAPATPVTGGEGTALTVNGREVTGEELAMELSRLMQMRARGIDPQNLESTRQAVRKEAANNLVARYLLEQEVAKRNLDISAVEVDTRLTEIKEDFGSEEAFTGRLQRMGMTEDDLRKQIEVGIGIERLVEEQTASVAPPTPEEIENYYKEHIDWYTEQARIRASHILISVNPADDEAVRAEKKARAEELLEQVRGGANFAQLASQNSDCPSKSKGGDLNYFSRGQMVKEFEEAAFALDVGGISDVVETQFGYHIIKLTNRKDERVIPLDEASERIEEHFQNEKKEQMLQDFIEDLRESATIVYRDSTLVE